MGLQIAKDFDYDDVDEGTIVDFLVPARDIAAQCNPLSRPPWGGVPDPITLSDISKAISEGNIVDDPIGPGNWLELVADGCSPQEASVIARREHIGRIASMVLNMPDDAITVYVGMPSFGEDIGDEFSISDGNHRLAAALVLDVPVKVSFDGEWSEFQRKFPDAVVDTVTITPVP